MKLGEILIQKGVLTGDQLEMALKSQLIFGGHLGTRLIEMGLIDEDTLGEVLSSSAGVPYAPWHLLANIPPKVIKAVPEKIVKEYQLIPFKVEGRSVHLAFINPKDLRALDALKFATGRSIVPWVAPEVRVFQALEMYYGVERRARYIKLDHRLEEPGDTAPAPANPAPVPPAQEFGFFSSEEADATFGYGRPWQDVAAELFEGSPTAGDSAGHEPQAFAPPARKAHRSGAPGSKMSHPELAERYCQAESRDDLAHAVLDFASHRADRMLLMFVRGNLASVWEERGFAIHDAQRTEASFEVTSEALFHTLMGSDHFHGALPPGREIRSFYDRLGVEPGAEILLIPVHVNDHLVAAALIDGGPKGSIRGGADEFLKAFRLFSSAVLMVALRKNLRDVARPVTAAAS